MAVSLSLLGGFLIREDVQVEPLEYVLALVDLRRRTFEMVAGQGEVAAGLVHLDRPLAVIPPRQRGLDEDMQAGPGRRDLGIAVEGIDYLPGPWCDVAGL